MLLHYFSTLLLLSGIYFSKCDASDDVPSVQTPLGTITGHLKTSHEGRTFSAFEGIPYAKPPLGKRRFEVAEPVEAWDGAFNATVLTQCVQSDIVDRAKIEGTEDCLHLNVYVPGPQPIPDQELEVIVHIHGGAFMMGSGNAFSPPTHAMDHDFIYITFNYRLNIFGFLSTEDEVVPGNNGLKDQVLALKWIKDNVAAFGGNPNSITITGVSAGGASVHFHYFSELSEGLFHRGISQSGVALNPWALAEEPLEKSKQLADSVGCPTESTRDLVDCLKQKPYKQLLGKMDQFYGYGFMPFAPFGPVVEKGGSKPFLRASPYELLQKGEVRDVPWIASMCTEEGLLPIVYFLEELDEINEKWNDLAPFLLDFNYTLPKSLWTSTSAKIRQYYLGKDKISKENLPKVVPIFSERLFLADAETAVRLQAKMTKSPVFFYIFGYPGDFNDDKMVMHGSEIKYLFGNTFTTVRLTTDELKMKELLWDMFISYTQDKPAFKGVELVPTDYEQLTYLNLTGTGIEDIKLQTSKELTKRKFWTGLRFAENADAVVVKDEL